MYTPRSVATIQAQIIAAIEARTGQTTPVAPVAWVRYLALALAGAISLVEHVIAWSLRQIFPSTADEDYLTYLGDKYDMTRAIATAARLAVTISGDDGASISAGTLWASADSRLVYEQVALATVSGSTATAEVECLTPGADGNLADDSALSLTSPIEGVTGAVVDSTAYAGTDAESLDTWRGRIIQRIQAQPQGGAAGDYIRWALEVDGIAKALATRNAAGDARVYPLLAISGASRVPDATKLAAVQAYLQDPARRPLAANVYALTTVERTADITITGLSPSDAATKANIIAAIDAYLWAAYPRQYLDEAAPTHIITLAAIWAIVIANGASATAVTLALSGIGSGVTSYELPIGEIVTRGTVTWA